MDLNGTWFVLVGVLFFGYAMLDGFDLGVGMLHLFSRRDEHRRMQLNAIGPVWDGNEVWLVTGGGALFAAFPNVYATLFSAFYLPFMLLLTALIFRAVSIEFRSKQTHGLWRQVWDIGFFSGSFLASILLGLLVGNLAWGIPLNSRHEYIGGVWNLLHPYALLAIGLYPNMIPSTPEPANSLDIWQGASSPQTLGTMLIIALIGMPLVLGYTGAI